MGRYNRLDRHVAHLKHYLPDATTLVICLIGVATVLRGISAAEGDVCKGNDKSGIIGWIAVCIAAVCVTLEKYLRGKDCVPTITALVAYLLMQLSINKAPLKCVLETDEDDANILEIVQTAICIIFCVFYALIVCHSRND